MREYEAISDVEAVMRYGLCPLCGGVRRGYFEQLADGGRELGMCCVSEACALAVVMD
jgi:hypothetical protein